MISLEDKIKYQQMSQEELDQEFISVCDEKNLDKIKYLLTSPELTEHADIHRYYYAGFKHLCITGYIEAVKYMLTSPELHEKINLADGNVGLWEACYKGNLELVKYFLTSPELIEHADIYAQNNCEFIEACENNQFHIIDYLIMEYNMNVSQELSNHLKETSCKEVHNKGFEYALKLIEVRDFHNKLDSTLDIKNTKKIKRGKI